MKGSALVQSMTPLGLTFYACMCGWTLARAHVRSGDPVAIAEYLSQTDAFDKSITDFSERYADQNERGLRRARERGQVRAAGSGRRSLTEPKERGKAMLGRPVRTRRRHADRDNHAP